MSDSNWETYTYGVLPPLRDFDFHLRNAKDEQGALLVSPSPPAYWMTLVDSDEINAAMIAGLAAGKGVKAGPDREYPWKTTFEIRTIRDLHAFLQSLVEQWQDGSEAAGNLASSIMFTLHYEWV